MVLRAISQDPSEPTICKLPHIQQTHDEGKLTFLYSAKIIKMGASSKKKGVSAADDAIRSDHDTLGQLARLYELGKDTTENLAEEFNIAVKTPVPDDNEVTFGLVANHSFVSSDSGFIKIGRAHV